METFVSIERAIELARSLSMPTSIEHVPVASAGGRTLAEDLASLVDDPRFDNSAMDGWAVRSADDPASRTEVGVTTAGGELPEALNPGEAIRIMTGAPMPAGADAVVMIEDGLHGEARSHFVRRRAENLAEGQIALTAGTVLGPGHISLAATMGHPTLPVHARPRVAVISTGDELVPPGQPLGPSEIHESNSHGLCVLLEQIGAEPVRWPVVADTADALRQTLDAAAIECDAILTSGGVSMGDHDHVRKLMESEGDLAFWKVAMRPGGPPLFGTWRNTPLLGLPGNLVSSQVVFTMIAAPWLGSRETLARTVRVHLLDPVKGAPGKVCLRRIRIQAADDGAELVASTHTHQGSGNIHSMVAHDGLTLLPPDTDAAAGDVIDALWFR